MLFGMLDTPKPLLIFFPSLYQNHPIDSTLILSLFSITGRHLGGLFVLFQYQETRGLVFTLHIVLVFGSRFGRS